MVGVMKRHQYRIRVERSGDWWHLSFPDVRFVYAQTRRLDKVEEAGRGALAAKLDVRADSFDVRIEVDLPESVRHEVESVRLLRERAEKTQRESQAELRRVVGSLDKKGFTVRDIGAIVGVSAQRVSQVAGERPRASKSSGRPLVAHKR
jgi:hypothetical protein